MEVQFDVNEKIKLPFSLHTKCINDLYIVLAPSYPNWIILNESEYKLMIYFRKSTIMDSMLSLQKDYSLNDDAVLSIAQSLLTKIESTNFYSDAEIEKEDKIEGIKKKIHINLTNNCNMRCKHCFLSAGIGKHQELDADKLILFLNELYTSIGSTEVVVSGGEPLIYEKVFQVLSYLNQKGHRVILFTNGTLINAENIGSLKNCVDEIQISIEGISKENYEKIRGSNNYFKLINAINLININMIQLTLAITALNEVMDDIENELLDFLEKLNVVKLSVRLNSEIEETGNAVTLDKLNFKFNPLKETRIRRIINALKGYNYCFEPVRIRNIHFSNCGIGSNIVINYDGKIYPCSNFGVEYFNINDKSSDIISKFNFLNESTGLEYVPFCKNCELIYICNGGCRIKNFIINQSYIKPHCTNEMKERKYLSLIEDYYKESV